MKKLVFAGFVALASTVSLSPVAFAQDAQPQPQPQPTAPLGGAGESCRARADCKADLKCMNQVCTDQHEGETCGATSDCGTELKCINSKCTSPGGAHPAHAGGGDVGSSEWMKFTPTDGAIHPYVGITVGGGFDTGGVSGFVGGGFNTFDGAFLFALEGGIVMGNHQLSLEISPFTYIVDGKGNGPVFEALASYAYLIPLTTMGDLHFFWPIRFGAGILAGGDNSGDLAYFQMRADVLGVALHAGHAMVEFHLPTFRFALTDKGALGQHEQLYALDWIFGITAGYAF